MDDQLACVKTDSQGRFELHGSTSETTNIDPRLKIYTDCNDKTLYGAMSKVSKSMFYRTNSFLSIKFFTLFNI
jgi:hypothetical protein